MDAVTRPGQALATASTGLWCCRAVALEQPSAGQAEAGRDSAGDQLGLIEAAAPSA
jgi:hypothetical protein